MREDDDDEPQRRRRNVKSLEPRNPQPGPRNQQPERPPQTTDPNLFFYFCFSGDRRRIKELILDKQSDFNINEVRSSMKYSTKEKITFFSQFCPQSGFTGLQLASIQGHVEVLQMILDYKPANMFLKEQGDGGERRTALDLAVQYGHAHIVTKLLAAKKFR